MAKVGFHHHHTSNLLCTQTNPLRHSNCRSISISDHRFLLRLLSSPPLQVVRSSRRWDPNAESFNSKNFNFDDSDEGEGNFDDSTEQWDAFDDYIDSIWIFKVFSSFGWMLPAIIASLLLANGPKAFLMALVLPLGQSTFAFAIRKYQDRDKTKRTTKTEAKTKPYSNKTKNRRSRSRNSKLEEVAEWIGSERARKKKNKKNGYQSWVSKNDVSSMSSSDTSTQYNFGGWDELDAWTEFSEGSSRRASQESSGLRETPSEEKKKKKNRGSSDDHGSLLLRLLVFDIPVFELVDRSAIAFFCKLICWGYIITCLMV